MTATTFTAGQPVEWDMAHNRGWGGRWWVPAVFVRYGPCRVLIEARLASGGHKAVWVQPERLRAAR